METSRMCRRWGNQGKRALYPVFFFPPTDVQGCERGFAVNQEGE